MQIKKRVLAVVLVMVFSLGIIPTKNPVYANQSIKVATQNVLPGFSEPREYITFPSDIKPMNIDGRIYVPLRGLEQLPMVERVEWLSQDSGGLGGSFESGAGIEMYITGSMYSLIIIVPGRNSIDVYEYDAEDRSAFYQHSLDILLFGSFEHLYDLNSVRVDVPAQMINNRVMIPLRTLESMGMDIGITWEADTSTVLITYMES